MPDLKEFLSSRVPGVLFVHTSEAARQVAALPRSNACTIIATSPDVYFIFDGATVAYQSVEVFGLEAKQVVENVMKEFKAVRIGYFNDQLSGPGRNLIADLLRGKTGGEFIAFEGLSAPAAGITFGAILKRWLRRHPRIYYWNEIRRTQGFAAMMKLRRHQLFSQKKVLLLNNGYCWNFAHDVLFEKGLAIWGQVNLSLAGDRADDFLPLLDKKKFSAILFSINPTDESHRFTDSARAKKIPIIGWQHGDLNYVPGKQILEEDIAQADLFLNWGAGSQENRTAAATRYDLVRPQQVVGSSYLDDLGAKLKGPAVKNGPLVYATTMYYLANRSDAHGVLWSDRQLYQTQRSLISSLARLPGEKIVKLHPATQYHAKELVRYCRSFLSSGIKVMNEPTIKAAEVFARAGAIIIDTPSTTLLEALLFKAPVFCLTNQIRLSERALSLLKKRVVISESPAELMAAVERYVKTGEYGADIQNRDFFESFATQSDGRSAQRAADAVLGLIR